LIVFFLISFPIPQDDFPKNIELYKQFLAERDFSALVEIPEPTMRRLDALIKTGLPALVKQANIEVENAKVQVPPADVKIPLHDSLP